jgi:tRNA A-37 threonylcarbamoyl transferase component Bud32
MPNKFLKGNIMPSKSQLLLPKGISSTRKRRIEKRGTYAFLPLGSYLHEQEEEAFEHYARTQKASSKVFKKPFSKLRGDELPEALFSLMHAERALLGKRSEIASQSTHYLKRTSARIKLIRKILIKNGINVETPMQVRNTEPKEKLLATDLGKGFELFEKTGYGRIKQGPENFDRIRNQILEIVTKMHNAGITHNHLHLGNLLINAEGKIKLIDLSKAKIFSRKPSNKKEFLDRYASDIYLCANGLSYLKAPYVYNAVDANNLPREFHTLVHEEKERMIRDILKHHGKIGAKITPKEIEEHYYSMLKKEKKK